MSEMPMNLMYITPSISQLLIVLLIVIILFGRGKISEWMGDLAKGIRSFKKGLSDEDQTAAAAADANAAPKKALDHDAAAPRPEMRTGAGTETKA